MTPLLALASSVVGATLGLTMLVTWLRSGSTPPPLVYRHLVTALAGLAIWIVYLTTGRPVALAWTTFAVLIVANTFGDTLVVRGNRERHGPSSGPRGYLRAAKDVMRRPRAFAHATLSGVTFFSVLLAALGVGA